MNARRTSTREHEETIAVWGRAYTCIFTRVPDGYLVTCKAMPSLRACGATLKDARAEAAADIELWLSAHDEPVEADLRRLWYA
jgi:predicted RNase H-like HicB family nuclease